MRGSAQRERTRLAELFFSRIKRFPERVVLVLLLSGPVSVERLPLRK